MRPASARFHNHSQIGEFRWTWPHFRPAELADRYTGELLVVTAFMDWLEGVRHVFDKPMIITLGYRTALQQFEISGRRSGAHVDGMAVDVLVCGEDAERLERIAITQNVMGRGINQLGPHDKRYLHLDMWTKAPTGRRPALWNY